MKRIFPALAILAVSLAAIPALAGGDDLGHLAVQAKVSPAQAVQKSGQNAATVKEIELKALNGRPVYQIEFRDKADVFVDAVTGALVTPPPRKAHDKDEHRRSGDHHHD